MRTALLSLAVLLTGCVDSPKGERLYTPMYRPHKGELVYDPFFECYYRLP